MLLKLFKYDFKSVAKLALPMTLAILLTSILASLSIHFTFAAVESDNDILMSTVSAVCVFMIITWIIAVIAYGIGVKFAVVRRYYTHFFSDEGYLTFTLPCKTSTHFMSKILSGLLWDALSSIVFVVCVVIVVLGIPNINVGADFGVEYYLFDIITSLYDYDAVSIVINIFEGIVTSVSGLMILYIAVTIGAMLASKHKVLASVGFYFAISWSFGLIEIVATLVPQFAMFNNIDYLVSTGVEEIERMQNITTVVTTSITFGLHIIAILVFYFLNRHFLKKKLNLA